MRTFILNGMGGCCHICHQHLLQLRNHTRESGAVIVPCIADDLTDVIYLTSCHLVAHDHVSNHHTSTADRVLAGNHLLVGAAYHEDADNTALHNATQFFETHTVSALKDKAFIASCFISQIGESYRSAFESSGPVLVSRLKTNTKLTSDVYSWANKVGEIRKTVDAFLRDKFCGEAKKKVKSMPEAQLRDKVVQLLDENPDLYTLFIK